MHHTLQVEVLCKLRSRFSKTRATPQLFQKSRLKPTAKAPNRDIRALQPPTGGWRPLTWPDAMEASIAPDAAGSKRPNDLVMPSNKRPRSWGMPAAQWLPALEDEVGEQVEAHSAPSTSDWRMVLYHDRNVPCWDLWAIILIFFWLGVPAKPRPMDHYGDFIDFIWVMVVYALKGSFCRRPYLTLAANNMAQQLASFRLTLKLRYYCNGIMWNPSRNWCFPIKKKLVLFCLFVCLFCFVLFCFVCLFVCLFVCFFFVLFCFVVVVVAVAGVVVVVLVLVLVLVFFHRGSSWSASAHGNEGRIVQPWWEAILPFAPAVCGWGAFLATRIATRIEGVHSHKFPCSWRITVLDLLYDVMCWFDS